MQIETVTAKYVNPAKGKGPASIKDQNGRYLKFWTNKIPLDTFRKDGSYEVSLHNEPYNGQDQFYIDTVKPVGSAQASVAPAKSNGNGDHSRDEHIFVCGVVNNAVASGKIDPLSAADLAGAIKAASAAYRAWQQQ